MKLLWVVNVIFPDFANKLGMESNPSGSWMYSLLDALKKKEGLQISVVTVYQGKEKIYKNVDNIDYYLIPNFKSNWEDIFDSINPNLVHIHGAEYNYGLNLLSTRPNCKYILSIQGIAFIKNISINIPYLIDIKKFSGNLVLNQMKRKKI